MPHYLLQLDINADACWRYYTGPYFTRRAKARKPLTFTNTHNDDLTVIYAALDRDEDDVKPNHDHDKPTRVDGWNGEDTHKDDYDPEQDSNKDSEDKDNADSNNTNWDIHDAPEIEVMYENAHINGQTKDGEEVSEVDDEPQECMMQRKFQEWKLQRKAQE